MSPVRVPIITPPNVAKPMLVSIDLPPSTAAIVTPLPRWPMTILRLSSGLSRSCAARRAT